MPIIGSGGGFEARGPGRFEGKERDPDIYPNYPNFDVNPSGLPDEDLMQAALEEGYVLPFPEDASTYDVEMARRQYKPDFMAKDVNTGRVSPKAAMGYRYNVNTPKSVTFKNQRTYYTGAPVVMTHVFDETDVDMELPTSTSTPWRPRTVAAAYSASRGPNGTGTLTIAFRDGTLYNYYGVTPSEWEDFKSSPSKGEYLLNGPLEAKWRGPADVSMIDPQIREVMVVSARMAQMKAATDAGLQWRKRNRKMYGKKTGRKGGVYGGPS